MSENKKPPVQDACSKGLAGIHLEERLKPEQIPDLDLYMDQLITIFEAAMPHQRRSPDDKLITKPMINNYIKNRLLPPAQKKKYTRDHLMRISMLARSKQCANLEDIRRVFNALPDNIDPLYPKYLDMAEDLDCLIGDFSEQAAERIDSENLDSQTAAALTVQMLFEESAALKRLAEALSDKLLPKTEISKKDK
ncbi:MAG: DUF1836 domain-containing protein [Eubacteriaceae bacterium]|jgi:hypothetical protein